MFRSVHLVVHASTRIALGILLYIIMPGRLDAHAVRGGEACFCVVLCRAQLYGNHMMTGSGGWHSSVSAEVFLPNYHP